jgi:hypothetical protein
VSSRSVFDLVFLRDTPSPLRRLPCATLKDFTDDGVVEEGMLLSNLRSFRRIEVPHQQHVGKTQEAQ